MRRAMFILAVLVGACGPGRVLEARETACARLDVGELCSFVGRRGPMVGVCEQLPAGEAAVCVVQSSEAEVACAGAQQGERCAFEAAEGRVEGTCEVQVCRRAEAPAHSFVAEFLG